MRNADTPPPEKKANLMKPEAATFESAIQNAIPTPVRSIDNIMHRVAGILVADDHISQDHMDALEERAAWLDEPLDHIIRREKTVPQTVLLDAIGNATGIPVCRLRQTRIPSETLAVIPAKLADHYRLMPLGIEDGFLIIASYRLYDIAEEDHLRVILGHPLRWVLSPSNDITGCIKHYYGVGISTLLQADAAAGAPPDAPEHHQTNVSAFVEDVLCDAIRSEATDLHFEPYEEELRLRYRIDGVLFRIALPHGAEQHRRAIISSIKVLAQLDIAEKRLPKDGRFSFVVDDNVYDIRVSVLPTRYGEAVNLRVLNSQSTVMTLGDLGINNAQKSRLKHLTAQPYGMVLFSGPTGCGKTTSLYATLANLNNEERKIITIEDPVEYQVRGITQLQVHPAIGFTFANGLRSILRHDPDVVLVGEIRDDETARIAIGAAMTGHMVLSTIHTNDAVGAIPRLMDMGVAPYLVAAGLSGVVAQRLVRRICTVCKRPVPIDVATRRRIELEGGIADVPDTLYEGAGCPDCRFTGYRGRRAILEILVMDETLRSLTAERTPSATLLAHALDYGLVPLCQDGWQAAIAGDTTAADVVRVINTQD